MTQKFTGSRGVRTRYGNRSHMWIVRKLKNDPTFPKPVRFGRLRMWEIAKLDEWDKLKAVQSNAIPV